MSGGSGHDRLARPDLTGERHLGDTWVCRHRTAGAGISLDDIEHPVGNTRLRVDLCERDRREWREFGGLVHHRVPAREGGSGLPARDLNRVVPSTDAGHHTERLAPGVREVTSEVVVMAMQRAGNAREIFDALGARYHVHGRRFADWLAGVRHLEVGQFVVALPQERCGPVQNAASLLTRHRCPVREGLPCRADCQIHILVRSVVDDGDDLTSGGIDGLECLSGCRLDEPTPDEEPAMGNTHMDLLSRRRA